MAVKRAPKFQTTDPAFDIVVTKLVTVGHVIESDNGSLSPVEAAMAMIGRDLDASYGAETAAQRAIDNYEFRFGATVIRVETNLQVDSNEMPITDEWPS
jgi:hypothetical protein